jgi:hypothetical protein
MIDNVFRKLPVRVGFFTVDLINNLTPVYPDFTSNLPKNTSQNLFLI